jgi:hemoglobin
VVARVVAVRVAERMVTGSDVRETEDVRRPSVFEFAGGEAAFQALAAATHERCVADPMLSHPFAHGDLDPRHVERLGWYWAEVFGGPPRFSEACGGHSAMLALHAGQGAEADLGERFVAAFVGALDDAGLPGDPPFREVLRAYIAWANDEVMRYSPAGSRVPEGQAMPRWGWDGLEDSA